MHLITNRQYFSCFIALSELNSDNAFFLNRGLNVMISNKKLDKERDTYYQLESLLPENYLSNSFFIYL